MADIKKIDLNPEEKDRIVREIFDDNPGKGVVYSGKYHLLAYKPILTHGAISKSKCIGVELFISKVDGTQKQWTPEAKVPYRQSIFAVKESFKSRLQTTIKEQIALTDSLDKAIDDAIEKAAKEKREREKAIEDHISHTRSCQLKIDSTIKMLVPTAKSVIEVNSERLLMEQSKQEFDRLKSVRIAAEADEDLKQATNAFMAGDYDSEIEKQHYANDVLINREMPNRNHVETELVSPGNPKYLTDLERSNAEDSKVGVVR
jgi:mRNA-degrading endonuclease YafQ of YafQ-DinJ toxin-antitoxin module